MKSRILKKCPALYQSHAVYQQMQRNNCAEGWTGDYAEYTLAAGAFSSTISQEHADLLAQRSVDAQAQQFANNNASCIRIYRNVSRSVTFYSVDCAAGKQPGAYVYTVPANKYSSAISQQDADDQAEDEIKDYGQYYADVNGPCNTTTEGIWEGDETSQTRCQTLNGTNTGKTEIRLKNVNSASSTYNQYQWFEMAENILGCSASTTVYARLGYENIYSFGWNTYGDVVVKFYSDAAGTQPVSVNGLQINFYQNDYCTGNSSTTGPATANGSYTILASGAVLQYQSNNNSTCDIDYYLTNGSGYSIAN